MKVSIIVPVLNEAAAIRPLLAHLRERAPGAEIIVVDGSSSDGTGELAAELCDHLVRCTERGRAIQMNAGARVAGGDVFWFLHADVEVPTECLEEVGRILQDPGVSGGYFRIRLPRGFVYRLSDSFGHYAGFPLRIRCGDHGIFCRRSVFLEAGGYPQVPVMEDVEFYRRLWRYGRVVHSDKRMAVSPRRYEAIGPTRLTLAYGLIVTLYYFGVSFSTLARIYRRACCGAERESRSKTS